MIRVIVFDLGNVVLNFDIRLIAQKIAKHSSLDENALFDLFFDSPLTQQHDEGKLSARKFYQEAMQKVGATIGFDEFKDIWNNIFVQNDEVAELVSRLAQSKQYKLILLSNINKMHFDYIKETFAIIRTFDHTLTSYEVGERKPHPKIYRAAIEAAGTDPHNILFIDDRMELVEGAKHLGINAIQFKDSAQLKNEMKKFQVTVN
jgi:putative hydrolase of the HAD superfamily